jgi:hypothetical protein
MLESETLSADVISEMEDLPGHWPMIEDANLSRISPDETGKSCTVLTEREGLTCWITWNTPKSK